MNLNTYKISLSFNQILELVKQLPMKDKIRLSQELEKETMDKKLTQLLKTFATDDLSLETITEEVEKVRAEMYAKKKKCEDNS